MKKLPRVLPDNGEELEHLIWEHEQWFGPLKEKNNAQIVWADEDKKEQTDYAIVYLHGFTASHIEGDPWHRAVAQQLDCNLYLSRLHSHGLAGNHYFEDFSYQKLLASAVDACRIGQKLGKKVLLMGTSTGGLLALYIASRYCSIPVDAVMVASPLVHFYGIQSLFLENKAGRFLARQLRGVDYKHRLNPNLSPAEKKGWYPYAPLGAALTLGQMVEIIVKPALFRSITCPAFITYYNRDANNHDRVVSPHAIEHMANQLATAEDKKQTINFTRAGTHVIGSGLISNVVPELIVKTVRFLHKKAGIEAVKV